MPATEPIQALYIISLLDSKLKDTGNMFMYCLALAIKNNSPAVEIIKTIQEQARDNRPVVTALLGVEIMERVDAYWLDV